MAFSDHELGMHRRITRRDFLNGVAISTGALLSPTGSEQPFQIPIPKLRRTTILQFSPACGAITMTSTKFPMQSAIMTSGKLLGLPSTRAKNTI